MKHGNSLFRLNRNTLRQWLLKPVIRSQANHSNRGSNRRLRQNNPGSLSRFINRSLSSRRFIISQRINRRLYRRRSLWFNRPRLQSLSR